MKRNHGNNFRYHGLYRDDYLREILKRSQFKSAYALARHLKINADTTYRVFNGKASHKQVWPIAQFFGVDWSLLHDLNLPLSKFEFDRAVLNPDSKAVRSSGPAQVGVRRPAPLKRGATYTPVRG